jgi:hypothetical protein
MMRRLMVKVRAMFGASAGLRLPLAVAAFIFFLGESATFAQEACPTCTTGCATCATGCCQMFHCPPALKWCMEGKPRICFQHGCPKPICNPCEAPNWGYYQKCWTPWPWPPDWSHCPVPPPAAQVFPGMIPAANTTSQVDELPPLQRRVEPRPGL